jgi:intracellular septation protein A
MSLIQMLGMMLPLLVFIVIDAVYKNIKVSIIAAIACAIVQLLYYYFKTGKIDWFVFLDVGLIVGLGVVSIALKNEMFFKVKPAIIEVVAIILFLVFYFSPDSFLLDYFGRMLPEGKVLNPAAVGVLKNMLLIMCGYIFLHIGAVLYTAVYSSRNVWAFVSGPGFYLLFIPAMVVIFVKNYNKRKRTALHSKSVQKRKK